RCSRLDDVERRDDTPLDRRVPARAAQRDDVTAIERPHVDDAPAGTADDDQVADPTPQFLHRQMSRRAAVSADRVDGGYRVNELAPVPVRPCRAPQWPCRPGET